MIHDIDGSASPENYGYHLKVNLTFKRNMSPPLLGLKSGPSNKMFCLLGLIFNPADREVMFL
jgi:hypothetical protein